MFPKLQAVSADSAVSPEDQYRETFKDVAAVASVLAPICNSVSELEAMCKLAATNDGQLRLLVHTLTAAQGKTR